MSPSGSVGTRPSCEVTASVVAICVLGLYAENTPDAPYRRRITGGAVMDVGGVGVVVFGCGIDVAYPREHERLGRQILDAGGAIVTEYPPRPPPDGWRFPSRNRIIAGLSAAVVVVEAARKAGALITAVRAGEYRIAVSAMPGDVDRTSSEGCNLLIRDGAFPVLDPDDLVEELRLVRRPQSLTA